MRPKFVVVAVVGIAVAILGLYAYRVTKQLHSYTTGTVSTDIGVRDIIKDRKPCKEYFRLRDGRVMKTECPP
jgi:hypothetical protein